MKIASLETFTNQFVCFVRVTTDSGALGWGQTSTYNADITASVVGHTSGQKVYPKKTSMYLPR